MDIEQHMRKTHPIRFVRRIPLRKDTVLGSHLIVVGELLALLDGALRVDHDVQLAIHAHGLGVAVGIAAVVYEARLATLAHA